MWLSDIVKIRKGRYKAKTKVSAIRFLMILSEVLIAVFVIDWIILQYKDREKYISVELSDAWSESKLQIVDSVLMRDFIKPALDSTDDINFDIIQENLQNVNFPKNKTTVILENSGSGKEKTKKINPSSALKWALQNPDITTCIPGMTEYEHLDADIKLLSDITFTESDRMELTAALSEQGLYCNQCTSCLPQCPKNLPVNELMRAYMYAYGYSSPKMAGTLLKEIGAGPNPCSDCNSCTVNCTKNFNVREKIADISRLTVVPEDFLA